MEVNHEFIFFCTICSQLKRLLGNVHRNKMLNYYSTRERSLLPLKVQILGDVTLFPASPTQRDRCFLTG